LLLLVVAYKKKKKKENPLDEGSKQVYEKVSMGEC
jgi:hypothetical protein